MDQRDARPIVYMTSGIFGYLYRFFPIGKALLERGHGVVIVTASGVAAEHAAAAGFDVRHLARQEAALAEVAIPRWSRVLRPFARRIAGLQLGPRRAARSYWARRSEALLDTREVDDVLDELDPCLVLTEAEEHRDIRVVKASARALLLFEDLYSVRPGPDVPFPGSSHHVPTGSVWSRLRTSAGWRRFFLVDAIRQRIERWWVDGYDWHSTLRELADRAGIDEAAVSTRYFQFYDYTDTPRIRTAHLGLSLPGEPQPPTVVGPIVDAERQVHQVDPDFPAHWERVIARRAEGARVIYVSLGTFVTGMATLTQRVIDAATEVAEAEVIVSVGRDADLWRGAVLPSNVAVFERVPQMQVLEEADVVVSTGGLNTGHEALWFGVPVLNLPSIGIDCAGNAARLSYHRVGKQLVGRQVRVERIRRELEALLNETEYRENASRMSLELRAHHSIDAAADVIEKHLGVS